MLSWFIFACLAGQNAMGDAMEAQPPNIVIVFVDDMGWGDLPSQGATGWDMPHLARLEREGTRFTHFSVAQPVCSASRAALLTGCWPNRIGIHGALGPWSSIGIHEDEVTLAEICKQQGYATAAIGKWHLGYQEAFLPTRHGFDSFFGIPYSNDMWPGHPERPQQWPPLPLVENVDTIEEMTTLHEQDQLTARLTARAVEFIDDHHERPFFLYLAHPQPHVPLACGKEWKGTSRQGAYGDVMQEIDWSVGEVLRALDHHGISDHTIVMFSSDNGPWLSYGDHAGSSGGLREGKGTTFEGGVRVPCIIRWPNQVASSAVSDVPWGTIDLLPTLAHAIQASPPDGIDGVNAYSILKGGDTAPREIFLSYYRTNELQAVRMGRWKLHLPHGYRSLEGRDGGQGGIPSSYTYGLPQPMALYDLLLDPSETTDVQSLHPEVMVKMREIVEQARAELGDSLVQRVGNGIRAPGRVSAAP